MLSPAGIKAAEYLKERFGTPYEIRFPLDPGLEEKEIQNRKILVVQQQVKADSLRKALLVKGAKEVVSASYFLMQDALKKAGDVSLKEEDDFTELVKNGSFDVIIADVVLKPLAKDFNGQWIDSPHFAVSGKQVVV